MAKFKVGDIVTSIPNNGYECAIMEVVNVLSSSVIVVRIIKYWGTTHQDDVLGMEFAVNAESFMLADQYLFNQLIDTYYNE